MSPLTLTVTGSVNPGTLLYISPNTYFSKSLYVSSSILDLPLASSTEESLLHNFLKPLFCVLNKGLAALILLAVAYLKNESSVGYEDLCVGIDVIYLSSPKSTLGYIALRNDILVVVLYILSSVVENVPTLPIADLI